MMKSIERLGTDTAIAILMEAAELQASVIARELKEKLTDYDSLELGEEVYRVFMGDAGAEVKIYKRDMESVTFIVNRCPFFEAFLDIGVDCSIFSKSICGNLALPSIQAVLNQFNSNLKIETLINRESIEDYCLERVYIDK
jgi:hypothetical protein